MVNSKCLIIKPDKVKGLKKGDIFEYRIDETGYSNKQYFILRKNKNDFIVIVDVVNEIYWNEYFIDVYKRRNEIINKILNS